MLGALETPLLHEDVVAEAVKACTAERKRLRASGVDNRRRIEKRLADIEVELRRAVNLVMKGFATDALGSRMKELEGEKVRLKEEARQERADVVEFHPRIAERYRVMIRELRETLASAQEEANREAVEMIRALTHKIVVYPKEDAEGWDLELHGQLAAILEVQEGHKLVGMLVAGARFELATFRL